MNTKAMPRALLELPDGPGRSALKAGLLAMRLDVAAAKPNSSDLNIALRRLETDPRLVVFADISPGMAPAARTMLELDRLAPRGSARRRIFLTRLASGHINEPDRRLVTQLGFGGLFAEFDARDGDGTLRVALRAVADAVDISVPEAAELDRYVRVLDSDRGLVTERSVVRSVARRSAEALAAELLQALDIRDRTYRFQLYPHCFVGSEAANWMRRRFECSHSDAVALGQALGELGLLVHVTHDHPFLDDYYFYRIALSGLADALDLFKVIDIVRTDKELATTVLGQTTGAHGRCWRGVDAVELVARRLQVRRFDAWLALSRLANFGFVERVGAPGAFVDGNIYYGLRGTPGEVGHAGR